MSEGHDFAAADRFTVGAVGEVPGGVKTAQPVADGG